MATTSFNTFLLDVNFDKSTIRLHFLLIFSMLAKFLEDQKLIAMSSIKCWIWLTSSSFSIEYLS